MEKLKGWVTAALLRTTCAKSALWIENEIRRRLYEGRSGLIALLHRRLGLEYHKPNVIPRKRSTKKKQ